MFGRKTQGSGRSGNYSRELCRAAVRVPATSVLQELGHHHAGPRRNASDRVQTHALVRLLENGRSPVHNGRYCLVTVGGDMDPYPTFPVDSVTAAYRVFLLVQAVIAAGQMDANGRAYIVPAIVGRGESSPARWAEQVVGRERFQSIRNFPASRMPSLVRGGNS